VVVAVKAGVEEDSKVEGEKADELRVAVGEGRVEEEEEEEVDRAISTTITNSLPTNKKGRAV
jgi:hypothetical protein